MEESIIASSQNQPLSNCMTPTADFVVLNPENGQSRLICLHCRIIVAVGDSQNARESLDNHNCDERKKSYVSAIVDKK
jgi:hypothetical protein